MIALVVEHVQVNVLGAIAEGDSHFEIDEAACVECGTCAGVCPVSAISN